MKKTLTILVILAITLIAMIGNVNATTTMSVNPSEVEEIKAGETVTLTIDAGEGKGVQYVVSYDKDKFTYDDTTTRKNNQTIMATNSDYKGTGNIFVSALSTKQTLTFTAKVDIPAAEAEQIFKFNATDILVNEAENTETAEATLTVKKVDPVIQPEEQGNQGNAANPGNTDNGSDTNKESDGGNSDSTTDEKVGTNGKVIKKLPQTGMPVYVGTIALVVIAGVVLAVKKIRK